MIAAAGSGERLGAGGPKAFVELAGRPLLEWSLEACRAAGAIDTIVVAAPPGEESRVEGLGVAVVTGGASRSESVAAALERVETDLVAIHDAARPLVSAELFDAVLGELAAAERAAGVIAAAPLTDTVKEAGDDRVVQRTVDRSRLWGAQTPQAFRTGALREAISAPDPGGATDEAMLIEAAGGTVLLHDSGVPNLKLTTAEDLRLVELLLAR
ncbi:MAG: 2-C-methyl-D-erythritol 4-phosphate cytidylyltransferase [Solirubrobacterales bacterium]